MDFGIPAMECLEKQTQMRADPGFEYESLKLAKSFKALLIAQKQSMVMIDIFAIVCQGGNERTEAIISSMSNKQ